MYKVLRSTESLPEDLYEKPDAPKEPAPRLKSFFTTKVLVIALIVSVSLNIITTGVFSSMTQTLRQTQRSKYAGLERTVPRQWTPSPYDDGPTREKSWHDINIDLGNIALDDSYAQSMGPPRAQRFPWDPTKGVYLLNAHHNLHCMKSLRLAMIQFHTNTEQTVPWGHVLHCFDVLREEIICNADDTPRYTGFQPDQASGLGQVRMCKDWTQLDAWSKAHTACWRYVGNSSAPGFRELDRYRFCPEGSPWQETAETAWIGNEEEQLQAMRVAQAEESA
ncbi:MAG: hypothetical protein Q9220_000737 [cf. Caloplaca sp. 1 TL-2023]